MKKPRHARGFFVLARAPTLGMAKRELRGRMDNVTILEPGEEKGISLAPCTAVNTTYCGLCPVESVIITIGYAYGSMCTWGQI